MVFFVSFLFFFRFSLCFAQSEFIILDSHGPVKFSDDGVSKLKKYDKLDWDIKTSTYLTIETVESSFFSFFAREKVKIKMEEESTMELGHDGHLKLFGGKFFVENTNSWGKIQVYTPLGVISLYRETRFFFSFSVATKNCKIWVEQGMIELPTGFILSPGFVALKNKWDTKFELVKDIPTTQTAQTEQTAQELNTNLFQANMALQGCSSCHEIFLYEPLNISLDSGLFYSAQASMHLSYLDKFFHLLTNVKVKNQFDQTSVFKKNMAYQSILFQPRVNLDFYAFNRWVEFQFPIPIEFQWRSINGDPSALFLSSFLASPKLSFTLINNHKVSISPIFQQAKVGSLVLGSNKIFGSNLEYFYLLGEGISIPVKLSIFQKENLIGSLRSGISYESLDVFFEYFDFSKNSNGYGYKFLFAYELYRESPFPIKIQSQFTELKNKLGVSFKDIEINVGLNF